MLLKIDFKKEDVVFQSDSRIILNVKYFTEFANGCHLSTVKGNTEKHFANNKGLSSKTVFVGRKGGISF